VLPADTDISLMELALEEADRAADHGDVPIGCVIVDPCGRVIGRAGNRREADEDPTAHAEILALRQASAALGTWYLCGCTLYCTLEPCPMCAGAIVNARIQRVVYGCDDPKAGAVRSLFQIASDPRLNHQAEVSAGILAEPAASRLREFFARLRKQGKK